MLQSSPDEDAATDPTDVALRSVVAPTLRLSEHDLQELARRAVLERYGADELIQRTGEVLLQEFGRVIEERRATVQRALAAVGE
jgi:hypothetical protein